VLGRGRGLGLGRLLLLFSAFVFVSHGDSLTPTTELWKFKVCRYLGRDGGGGRIGHARKDRVWRWERGWSILYFSYEL
jgi:hypothetical protein